MFKWIEKKDLIYWIIFILMIFVLGSDIGQTETLILNNWSFAGTIVSIILAVIAIMYTFDQSSLTVSSSKKLQKSAKRVEEATLKLENNNIDEIIANLENKITKIITEVQSGIDSKLSIHHNDIKILLENGNKFEPPFVDTFLNLSQTQWETHIKTHIHELISTEGVLLIHLYYKKKLSLKYNLNKVVEWYLEFSDRNKDDRTRYYDVFYGILRTYRSFGIIDFKEMDTKLTITYFDDNLYKALGKLILENKWEDKISIKKIINEYTINN